MTFLWIALGAALGAPARYLTDRFIQSHHDSLFPWGTLTVNIAGSFVAGLLLGLPVQPWVTTLGITGFCGALTTYSTFAYETVRLTQERYRFYALANIAVSIVAGLGAATVGLTIAHAVTG